MQNTAQLFSVILHCLKFRKGDTINFRFGGRSTTFCNSEYKIQWIIDTYQGAQSIENAYLLQYVAKTTGRTCTSRHCSCIARLWTFLNSSNWMNHTGRSLTNPAHVHQSTSVLRNGLRTRTISTSLGCRWTQARARLFGFLNVEYVQQLVSLVSPSLRG